VDSDGLNLRVLAHSGRRARGIPPQAYADHARAVFERACANIAKAEAYCTNADSRVHAAVAWAALYHDLGKLEPENQEVLRTRESGSLPINHVDAGVAYLLAIEQTEAAMAVYAHHNGLCDLPCERAKNERSQQDPSQAAFRDELIKQQTDQRLTELVTRHKSLGIFDPRVRLPRGPSMYGFHRRLLLSCLVDADHHDTARHYGKENGPTGCACRWEDRITSLDRYVSELRKGTTVRSKLRTAIYDACSRASLREPIWACESPVGTGKTTAVMAYLLRAAQELRLRHILVVLPFINIVDQAVKVYRKALVLPGENPEQVVAAHHHAVDFQSTDLRYLTMLWEAPIIVTTAVQFFETLVGYQPSRIRKLHQLPGSAVFIDEAHAAMPIHLWPFMWGQIKQLSEHWTCRFVLASGSLARFWENIRIMGEERACKVPQIIPQSLATESEGYEKQRMKPESKPEALRLTSLCDWIQSLKGARLVIVNTVHSAAVLARQLQDRKIRVLHLSTALAPVHRHRILRRARRWLRSCKGMDWVMIATSCIEAGVDLSFDIGLRERCRVLSLIQTGGRVNRDGAETGATVWDFVVQDPRWKQHPEFEHTRSVVKEIFQENMWQSLSTTQIATYSLEQEFKRRPNENQIQQIDKLEQCGNYPAVSKTTQIIKTATKLVIIDPHMAERIRGGDRVRRTELLLNSVQVWVDRVEKLALPTIGYKEEVYAWPYEYDPQFLGIMAGVLKLNDIEEQGYAII